ncbi:MULTISPECIES: MotA/TolQ/ExbB proton channel family protein [Asticcacaulis]|uniref:Outer membrane transport energization protein ExbB (TC 2.C.1.1.1) n=1 Tax=Asticcacaulis taihuensis TaxID=260084 RepID=A0A1G4QC55_9CAUL|nr:MotA/TolQ/ExbB proton channel family protein [Asticcacaulis taihuensis]SCW42082.1 outer membrane transport energization protein ExbB (TC 2.C.1.1.1) [Asticcacaulis taihuensis]
MLEHKKSNPLIALLGAAALLMSAPAMAATAAAPTSAAASVAAPTDTAAPAADEATTEDSSSTAAAPHAANVDFVSMFMGATVVVKLVMTLLAICSVISWVLLIMKLMDFSSLNRVTTNYLEAYRGARSIADINRISVSDEFAGNPLADMAAVATEEVQLSKQAGLSISGEHRDSVLHRAQASVAAVQAGLAKRLSGGLSFLASVGSTSPFIGLFGTVYGIMNSFISIAQSHTTNLAVVAPGIAEALMATGLGLIAAIPAVVMYNIFNTSISNYGIRSEQFVSELINSLSRQLDKGA